MLQSSPLLQNHMTLKQISLVPPSMFCYHWPYSGDQEMTAGPTLDCPKEVSKKQRTPRDREFLETFSYVVTQRCSDPAFTTAVAAVLLGMSRMHLNRRLRSLAGRSIHECILKRRMAIARSMLTQPLPVAFVAQSVGFRSVSHFSKAFRRRTGMPPSVYRSKRSLPRQPTKSKQ